MKRAATAVSALVVAVLGTSGLLTWAAPGVSAQGQSTATMVVATTVLRKCVVQTVPLNFGGYDPVQVNATAQLDAQSTITVACTKGTTVTIEIDNGANAQARNRRMTAGPKMFLSYDLYKNAARTERWGDGILERLDAGVAPSRDPRQFIVYGRVPGAQDADQGAFQDTVVVTVNF